MDSVSDAAGLSYHEQLTLMIEQEIVAKLKELNLIPSAPSTESSDLSDIPTVRVKRLNKFPRSAPSYTSTCSLSVESGKWRAEQGQSVVQNSPAMAGTKYSYSGTKN